jgi:hypothetical protein
MWHFKEFRRILKSQRRLLEGIRDKKETLWRIACSVCIYSLEFMWQFRKIRRI